MGEKQEQASSVIQAQHIFGRFVRQPFREMLIALVVYYAKLGD
jgi:hypothetical protein